MWSCSFFILVVLYFKVAYSSNTTTNDAQNATWWSASSALLIPRELLIGGDDYFSVRLSPDGRTLAYLAPYRGVSNVWIRRLSPAGPPKPLTRQTARPIHVLRWAYDMDDGQTIIYAQDTAGEENFRLFAVRSKGDRQQQLHPRMLTPSVGVRAHLVHCSSRKPHRIVVALNERNRSCHDYYNIDIRTGQRSLIFENLECYSGAIFDDYLNMRVLAKETSTGGVDYYKLEHASNSKSVNQSMIPTPILLRSVEAEESGSTSPLSLDASGAILYWLDASKSDRSNLVAEHLSTGIKRTLYEPAASDLIDCTFHPVTGRPIFVYESYSRPRQFVVPLDEDDDDLDGAFGGNESDDDKERDRHRFAVSAWRRLRLLLPNNAEPFIVSTSHDFNIWLVVSQSDDSPVIYWSYKASTSTLTYLFSKNERLNRYELAHRRSVEVPTNDGWKQLCYLSLPYESVRDYEKASFKPVHPLPMVLFVHGGPWARDRWGFQNEAQLLANRGYAVLQCNYRGSTGFGKIFANAGDGQWGRRMQDDLTDAVRWAIREKIAAPERVAIAGFSYGGYAALIGLTSTPDLYACAVDAVGPSNLLTLMRSLPPYWTPAFSSFKRRLGADPTTDIGRQRLTDVSPFFHADRIRKPLLVAQGANDPRVKRQESDMIVRAARANNATVAYVLFEDEGHGFRRAENAIAFWALTEQFLSACLGGRAQPLADTIEKSSAHFIEDI